MFKLGEDSNYAIPLN